MIFIVTLAVALATYTQLVDLTATPGLHFDEAWQGVFAHRIASEEGFYPFSAMNSYTSPVIHYLLAGAFKFFGPTLEAMRGAYAVMNLGALLLFLGILHRSGQRKAMPWFALLWALLPLSVHNHRFYVEMTGFFGLCLALCIWGFTLWHSRSIISVFLIVTSLLAATYSHILFISVFAAAILVGARHFPAEFKTPRSRLLVATIAFFLVPLAIRMGVGLAKPLPFALASALGALGLVSVLSLNVRRLDRLWQSLPKVSERAPFWLALLSLPFLISFTGLMWNGRWPYAQATGYLERMWIPLNLLLLIALKPWRGLRLATVNAPERLSPDLTRMAFLCTFLFGSVLILKQSPRYYMVPTIFAMLWCSQQLGRLNSRVVRAAIATVFLAWNLWTFENDYRNRFEKFGSTTVEFRLGPFHDNGRDFRPFQKAFAWAVSQNCQKDLIWVEDDRFLFPVEFLRLTAPEPQGKCPWDGNDVFFSTIPDYDPNYKGQRNEFNTPTPPLAPHVKLLAHSPDWGDLAFWIRRK